MPNEFGYLPRQDLKGLIDEDVLVQTPLVAPMLAPEFMVQQVSASAPKLGKGERKKMKFDLRRNEDGSFNVGNFKTGSDTWYTEEFGWEQELDDVQTLIYGDYFDSELIAGQIAQASILLDREKRVQTLYQTEALFPAGQVQAVAAAWDDPTNAEILGDVDNLADLIFPVLGMHKQSLSLVIHRRMIENAIASDEVRGSGVYVQNMSTMNLSAKAMYLRDYLDVKEVIPVNGVYDTAGQSVGPDFGDIWSQDFASLVFRGSPGFMNPGFAKQPVYQPYSNDYNMFSYTMPTHKKTRIRAEEYRGIYSDFSYGGLLKDMLT